MIDDPHFQKNKPTSSKSKSHLRGNPPQANPNLRPSPSSPAFPHVLGLYFTEFSRTICVWPRILRPMARDPTKNISHPWVPRKNWQLKNEIGRGYVSFMKGMYYIYIYIWLDCFSFCSNRGNSSYWLCQFSGFGFKCSSKGPSNYLMLVAFLWIFHSPLQKHIPSGKLT